MKYILKVQSLDDRVEKISYAKDGDAGIDLRVSGKFVVDLDSLKREIEQESYDIKPNERILVKTGIAVSIPEDHWGNIRDRSGNAVKHGLHVLAGVIDESYRGEIGVVVVNSGGNVYTISRNDRIAQMIISPYQRVNIEYVDKLENTERGQGGFGHTGK